MRSATGYEFVPFSKSWLRRVLKPFVQETRWMVYRFPWQKSVKVTHPDAVDPAGPQSYRTRRHEFHHVQDFMPWWGPYIQILLCVLFPLPVLFSGRWFVERRAYRDAIDMNWTTVDRVVDTLGGWKYGWCWPKPWMRAWLTTHQKDQEGNLVA